MTLYGSRDFDRPRGEAAVCSPSIVGDTTRRTGLAEAGDERRILLRVHGGEEIVVGVAGDHARGIDLARRMMRLIDDAETQGEWPALDDRFIRPGAIVSIDVQSLA